MAFTLSDVVEFLCSSVIFVDGGTDAHFRAGDWPRRVSMLRLPAYALKCLRRWICGLSLDPLMNWGRCASLGC
ncbi:hypothetical protein BKG60_03915 [Mycobacterium syngnathidarum]|nr:hypothetical protein BKG60_03915 [Mycobacterium syngnathidarum]